MHKNGCCSPLSVYVGRLGIRSGRPDLVQLGIDVRLHEQQRERQIGMRGIFSVTGEEQDIGPDDWWSGDYPLSQLTRCDDRAWFHTVVVCTRPQKPRPFQERVRQIEASLPAGVRQLPRKDKYPHLRAAVVDLTGRHHGVSDRSFDRVFAALPK